MTRRVLFLILIFLCTPVLLVQAQAPDDLVLATLRPPAGRNLQA